MTPLPELPANLQSSVSKVPSLTQQIPQFPVVPQIPQVPQVEQIQNLQNAIKQADSITQKLIETAIPESTIDSLMQTYKLPDGSVDFEKISQILNSKADMLLKSTSVPEIPKISFSGGLASLIPDIPVVELPTPAKVKKWIDTIIEKRKAAQQQLITQRQLEAARLEAESPFTVRKNILTDVQRITQVTSVVTRPNI